MPRNNSVYLLVGQRGSGKSEYAKKLFTNQPGLSLVSRDEIFVRLFGSEHSDPYSGWAHLGLIVTHRLLRRKLSTQTGLKLILDCWTSDSDERKYVLNNLRMYGADRVTALYFVTPLESVKNWFWKKPKIAKMTEMRALRGQEGFTFFSENTPVHDYEVFHEWAQGIDSDGFDEVIRVNPLDPLIVLD